MTLAPESGGKSGGGSMGALAAMAGINLGTSSGEDALSPELYPDIVSSTFLIELFDVKVKDQKSKSRHDFVCLFERRTAFSLVECNFPAPFKVLGWTLSLFKDEPKRGCKAGSFSSYFRDESAIADALKRKRISVSRRQKTGVTTLSVTMQDPLISASLTDTVMHCLQNYITDYRTNKGSS